MSAATSTPRSYGSAESPPHDEPADGRTLRQDLKRIARILAPERRDYTIGLASLLVLNFCDVLAPVFLAVAVDLTEAAFTGGTPNTSPLLSFFGFDAVNLTIGMAVAVFLSLHVVTNVLRYPMVMYVAVPSHRIGQRLRNALVGHLLRLPQPFYDRARSGDLMARATSDLHAARMMLGPGILVGADTIFLIGFVFLVLLSLSWKLALIVLIPLPLIGWVTNRLSHAEYQRYQAVQEDISKLTERARESYAGIRIIQGYARESFDRARFQRFSHRHYRKNLHLARIRSVFDPTLDLLLGLSTVLVLIFGGLQVVDGELSTGTFIAFVFLVGYLSGPMIGFGWSVSLLQRGRASLRRIDRLLQEPVEIDDPAEPSTPEGEGHIRVRNLSYTYPTPPPREDDDPTSSLAPDKDSEREPQEPALVDVSLDLPAGRTLGVIGPVGSGKSTLIRLLTRLYDPPSGTITIDEVDVRDMRLGDLRSVVGVAPQDTFLFSDTVERNLLLGLDDAAIDAMGDDPTAAAVHPRERASELARLACLHDELLDLSEGYETMLGERGVNLSGGQRQRLAIGRAIAADPQILVLDDCLSAVDARTEEAILSNLREVFAGRSGIVVSHRVVAVQDCDEIVVLEAGRIAERGSHAALLARPDGWYARVAAEQSDHASAGEEESE